MIDALGGDFSHEPDEMGTFLSPKAGELVERAFQGIDPDRMIDYHVHVVGLGIGGTGCFVNPDMQSWLHPIQYIKFAVYVSASGVEDLEDADREYVLRLLELVRHNRGSGKYHLLAMDMYHLRDGTADMEKTGFFVPNDYVLKLAAEYPDHFRPTVSVHPYRKDALRELERCHGFGARFVKWLPNTMGIDPSDELCEPFYRKMKELGMVLLTHVGDEEAVEADEDQQFGNPLLLRKPLEMGVKVIAAHCASLGRNRDLDDPEGGEVDNFDLFLRLMEEKRYEGLLFGDISALTQHNRLSKPLLTLLEREDLHSRLVNGSDYPLPAVNIVIRTRTLVREGFITAEERILLNEIYDYNPLLFDFLVKRTLRHPVSEKRFPDRVFMAHPALRASPGVQE